MTTETQDPSEQAHDRRHEITVIVNAQKKKIDAHALTFGQVVDLAYDNNPPTGENWSITVTYRHGPHENPHGSLLPGGSVQIREGMIFNVKATDRS